MPRSDRHHHHGGGGGGGGGGHYHHHGGGGYTEPSEVWMRRRAAVTRRAEERRLRYLLLGVICMIPGLMLYFGGGYLFVAAYNGQFPFVDVLVGAALKRCVVFIWQTSLIPHHLTSVLPISPLCIHVTASPYNP